MNWDAITFDWNQARAFLATAEEGSLSAAARVLNQTQPTLSRQVAALEQALGVLLFERVGRSMVLTAPGHELLSHVREMALAASKISLTASSEATELEGKVILTTTNTMATYHLAPMLAILRERAPGIELQITTSNSVRDLTRREADIAIRHGRPEQPELIAKLLGETTARIYASPKYLDKYGTSETMLPYLMDAGMPVSRENFRLSVDNGVSLIEYVRQGLGMSILTQEDANLFPDLKPVLPELTPFTIPVWLVVHKELHTSARYRFVFDLIADMLGEKYKFRAI